MMKKSLLGLIPFFSALFAPPAFSMESCPVPQTVDSRYELECDFSVGNHFEESGFDVFLRSAKTIQLKKLTDKMIYVGTYELPQEMVNVHVRFDLSPAQRLSLKVVDLSSQKVGSVSDSTGSKPCSYNPAIAFSDTSLPTRVGDVFRFAFLTKLGEAVSMECRTNLSSN